MKKLLLTYVVTVLFTHSILAQQNRVNQEFETNLQNSENLPPSKDYDTILKRATIMYSINTDLSSPKMERPFTLGDGTSGSCNISGLGNNVPYKSQGLMVDTSGNYTITANHTEYDGFLLLYQGTFSPFDSCVDLIAFNDNFNDEDDSQLTNQNLTTGIQYWVVHTGNFNSEFGSSEIVITGVGQPSLPVELQSFSIE